MPSPSSKLNLLNDSTMVKSARRLYNALRRYAPYKQIKDSIFISRVEGRGDSRFITVGINMNPVTGAPFARTFDIGSGIHGKKRRKYSIKPVHGRFLQFPGTNEYAGQIIRVKEVKHPGVKGTGYTQRAIAEVRPSIRNEIAKEVKDNLRLYLKAEFQKFGK